MAQSNHDPIRWPKTSAIEGHGPAWESEAEWMAELAAHPAIRKVLYGGQEETSFITWQDVEPYAESAFRHAVARGKDFSPEAYGVTVWLWSNFPEQMEKLGLIGTEIVASLHLDIEQIFYRNGIEIRASSGGDESLKPDEDTLRFAIADVYGELEGNPWPESAIKSALDSIQGRLFITTEKDRLLDMANDEIRHFGRLAKLIHALNYQWWLDLETGKRVNRNVGELLMLVVSELAEALEGHRKGLQDDKLPHRQMFEVELADAIIRILDMAAGLNLDIAGAVIEKLRYNAKRYDHTPEGRKAEGGKRY